MGKILVALSTIALALTFASTTHAQALSADEIYSENGPFMAPLEPDPGIPDTVTAESKVLPSGTTEFTLEVYLYNDEELGGFNLPISWDSPDISCDSISFVGTRIEYVNTKLFSIDNANQRLQAGMVIFFEEYLQPGNGSVYTVYFSVNPAAADQNIVVDSTFYPPGGNFALTLTNGFNIIPQYVQGFIQLGEPQGPISLLDPTSFEFNAEEGGGNPPSQTLNITNDGGGTLEWSLLNNTAWLSLDPTSGTGDGSVEVSADITGLSAGTYYDTIVVTSNADNSPQDVPVTLIIAEPPEISLDPASISILAEVGSTVPSEQITVTNTGGGTLNWTAANQTGWASIDPTSGVGDGIITVEFDLTGLTAGEYNDTVTVSDENASNSPQMTVITLTLTPGPEIAFDPSQFIFDGVEGGADPPTQTLNISNSGGGTLEWAVSSNSEWLSLDPTSGSGDGAVEVGVSLAGLTAGAYYDTIVITAEAAISSQAVPVLLNVAPAPPTILLEPSTIAVTATEGSTPPPEEITVTNIGGGELNWTAGNFDTWLSLDPTSGVGDGVITLNFDLTGLAPSTYVDTVVVMDENATNSPQAVVVTLVVEAEAQPEIGLSHTIFYFNATGGGGNPPAQTLTITNLGGGELDWTATKNESWLTLNPTSGIGDGTVEVGVDIAGLPQGQYIDTILISDPNAINSPQAVGVVLTIADFAFGTAIMHPEVQYALRANAVNPQADTIYIGDFGSYQVGDIDPGSILINGSLAPESWTILPSYPGFTGEVMEILVAARPFILGYGTLWDITVEEFTVSGQFDDMTNFEATGEVTFIGHTSGDANGDGSVDVGDPIFIIDYIFRGGQAPDPEGIGDANCDGTTDMGDVRYLIYYIFRDGPAPGCKD